MMREQAGFEAVEMKGKGNRAGMRKKSLKS